MPSITLKVSHAHPTQPGVMLNKLAVEGLVLTNGSNIDSPAGISVKLRPFATFSNNGVLADISPPNYGTVDMVIPDLYTWIAQRADGGDMVPATALSTLMQAIAEEFARQYPEA